MMAEDVQVYIHKGWQRASADRGIRSKAVQLQLPVPRIGDVR